jgi:osmoprotectant transport system ATP-binding protein
MIKINNVSKSYNGKDKILDNVSLDINEGEFVVLLGPSGCGKTTLLKTINRLHDIDGGDIVVKGKSIKHWNEIKLRRSIGYVIQAIGLLPHLTVKENIEFVLTLEKQSKSQKEKRSLELLTMMNLPKELYHRYPNELSGGQRQRVGVARALALNSNIILMDEPFGAVDEIARRQLQEELKNIHRKLGKTIVFVTHDIEEAFVLGTKIVFLNEGKIEQVGTPEEFVYHPKTETIKTFFGMKGFRSLLDDEMLKSVFVAMKDERMVS